MSRRNLFKRFRETILKGLVAALLPLAPHIANATPATSYFIYDESGHVIGEYDANGNPVQEHVYLGDRPVAVAVTNSGTTSVDYVSTDQLNTPRVITDSSKTVLWSWNSDPFGNGTPAGSLTYNLRFGPIFIENAESDQAHIEKRYHRVPWEGGIS